MLSETKESHEHRLRSCAVAGARPCARLRAPLSTKPSFTLDVHDLDAAGKSYSAPLPADWLASTLADTEVKPAGEPGAVDVRYSRTGDDIVIKGTVHAALVGMCARCLEPARVDATAELTLLLVPETSKRASFAKGKAGHPDAPSREDFGADDADLDTYSGDHVALDPFVREALLLEIPPVLLCSETCEGIAPPPETTGSQSDELDPRLRPLLALSAKAKKNGKES